MSTTLKRSVHIEAPESRVWEVLADLDGVYRYSPGVKSSHTTSSNTNGNGATRSCQLYRAGSIEESFSAWREGEGYLVEISKGPLPPTVKNLTTRFSLASSVQGGSAVTIETSFDNRMGPIGALVNATLVKRFLTRGTAQLAAGLKHFVETGEEVTQSTRLQQI